MRLPPFEDDDFSDLEPLNRIIGNATIVGLGEESHGDGTAFRMKARLVRYLHERLGFQVLAFETPLVDCERTVPLLAAGPPDGASIVRQCVVGEWSRAKQLLPLVDYLAAQAHAPHSLTTTAFDIIPRATTVDSLRSLFRDADFPEASTAEPWNIIRDTFFAARDGEVSSLPGLRESARAVVRRLRLALKSRGAFATAELLAHALDSVDVALSWSIDRILAAPHGDGGVVHVSATNVRDEIMAKNLLWLAEKRYPGKKIILWAASFHLLKSHESIQTPPSFDYHGLRTMGEILGGRLISIACIADEGKFSDHGEGSEEIEAHSVDSIESRLARAGMEDALVDLHAAGREAAWIHTPFIAGPLGYTYMRARWDESFDALVFTRHMDPSVELPEAEAEDAGRTAP